MWFLILLLVTATRAAKLDQTYLPPSSAASAGGYPGDIAAPFPSGGAPPSGSFVPPPAAPPPGSFPGAPGQGPPPPGGAGPGAPPAEVIPIISYENNPNMGDGSYSFSYETGNGIKAQEEGVLKQDVPEGPGEAVHGIYAYTGPDGMLYSVAYTADENGFVAKGDHLPTAPPIPPEIQAALEQNAAEEAAAAAAGPPSGAPATGYPSPSAPAPAVPAAPVAPAAPVYAGYPPATTPSTPAQIGYFKSYPSNHNYNHNQYTNQYKYNRYYRRF